MKIILKILLPLILLVMAFGIVKTMVGMRKEAAKKPARVAIPEVDTIQVSPADHKPPVRSFGTVQALFETTLTPQISGKITEVTKIFQVGNMVKEKMVLARIDATDFHAALAREQSNLETAKRTLAEEEIRSQQAAEDWVSSGRKLEDASAFVLRKPQLAAAKANIVSSEAAVQKALADIERTIIRAPYDAVVTERNASKGNLASPQTTLGTLVATSKVEVRLPLTVEQVSRITLPKADVTRGKDGLVKLSTPKSPGYQWDADIVRTEPTVDPQNQVTYVIAEVMHPYADLEKQLAVGTFVNAAIPAGPIENTLRIPEEALVNDSYIWVVSADGLLQKHVADRIYSLDGEAYIRLKDEAVQVPMRIVSRPLANFREDMKVNPTMPVSDS